MFSLGDSAHRENYMQTLDDIERLEKIIGQLQAAHSEVAILAKKSPSDPLNSFKLKMINKVIQGSNDVLGKKYKPFDDFTQFEEDDLPSNSDVTMLLAQYMEETERYRSDNVVRKGSFWFYFFDEEVSNVVSGAPSKVGK